MNSRISAVAEVSGFTLDPAQAVVTWQIVVGALGRLLAYSQFCHALWIF